MRILVAESQGFSGSAGRCLSSLGDVVWADLGRPGLLTEVAGADVLFVRLRNEVDREVLERASRLRAVVSPTTGLDHLDLVAMEERGVAVLSLRGETDFLRTVTATAEHAWGLLLALLRHIPEASAAAASGVWDRDRFRGREVAGKTLGIVGLGRLGTMVARYGAAFGMRVLAHDPFLEPWPAEAPPVIRAESLSALLAASDVVSLHVPLTDKTRGLLDGEMLATMKPGAVLVNTSRGGIVDEDALLAAVREGRLAGAALDVVEGEMGADGPGPSPLVTFAAGDPRILLTPHIGGATLESMENTEIFMAEKLARWLGGESVRVDAGPSSAGVSPPPDPTPS